MRKYILLLSIILSASITVASAQSKKSKKEEREKKIEEFMEESRKALGDAGNAIGDFFGLDDRVDKKEDLIKIKHVYYMPLYNVNLYKGNDAEGFRKQCSDMFSGRFPQAKVLSIALPQQQWVKEDVVKSNVGVGHTETMYCYIIAKDGDYGYINARFSYKRYKGAGKDYTVLEDNWPKWERTDFLKKEIYTKLKAK